ncbi:MAG: dethiobiotin synthase [Bacteroides sp.]|nr:dethiobiotin synthase [Bacteroides sp.]
MPSVLFVTGIGTDVGKSFVTGWLAREFIASGIPCITQKMIQTGNNEFSEDIERHRNIMGTGYLDVDRDHTTAPVIFTYPASPHLAARLDGKEIDLQKISDATKELLYHFGHVLIEGAGGLMVPIKGEYLTADYIRDNDIPVVVTVTGQLGSINHALLTFNALKSYGIKLFATVYNPHFDKDATICNDTRDYLKSWLSNHFAQSLWLEMPEIISETDV